jgi:CPA1 family monovalent cation:H+ antiporter
VWETAVFALNILAFIFIGLQIGRSSRASKRPTRPLPRRRRRRAGDGDRRAARLAHVVQRRVRWRDRRFGFHPPRPMLRPTVGSGLVISWAGMRGIVSLAAAMALPSGFRSAT